MLGVRDELKLSLNAAALLAERYLRRDEQDVICESTAAMVTRVAQSVAAAEEKWARGSARAHADERRDADRAALSLLCAAGRGLALLDLLCAWRDGAHPPGRWRNGLLLLTPAPGRRSGQEHARPGERARLLPARL